LFVVDGLGGGREEGLVLGFGGGVGFGCDFATSYNDPPKPHQPNRNQQ
jgi:hypothetical protein